MCGIAGIFRFDGHFTSNDVEAVLRMLDAQVHRGPDDWGILLPAVLLQQHEIRNLFADRDMDHVSDYESNPGTPAVILGSRRLSILDLSARGRMPMTSEGNAKRLWVTQNGEIYNSPQLREELRSAGYAFRSTSDSEVLINGYERWGDELLHRLRGMFALALFDSGSGRFTLARDRFGIKPLYYSEIRTPQSAISNAVVFASEVRAMLRSELITAEVEPEAAVRFLQLGSVPAPLTTIRNVFALPAGHVITIDGESTSVRSYWSLSEHQSDHNNSLKDPGDELEVIAETRRLLDEAVSQHLLSDVPLGIFLSGGIDSSALVALAAQFRNKPLTTLSIAFEEPEFDESKYARLIAGKYQTSHCETLLTNQELVAELPKVIAAMDQPTIDGVNSYFVSRAAKQAGLKVVLSGLGGDEVFLGYSHLRNAPSLSGKRDLLATLPPAIRRALIKVAVPAGTAAGRSGLEKLGYLQDPSDTNMYLLFRGLFATEQIQRLLGLSQTEMKQYAPLSFNGSAKVANRSLVDSFVVNDFQHYLQNQLLKDTDCMSMAHSIETRVPFLDHKLVEYVFGLPTPLKLNGVSGRLNQTGGIQSRMNKPLLVQALGTDLPHQIWDRPKMGFTFPFASWLRESNTYKTHRSATNGSKSLFQRSEFERVWTGFHDKRFHWSRPWALMVWDQFTSHSQHTGHV